MPGEIRIGRQHLIRLLNSGFPADAACQEALELGANYRIYAGAVGLEETIRIYKQRASQAEIAGREGLGVHDALGRLGASQVGQVLIGAVSGDREFTLFFTVDARAVVACLAV